MQRLGQHFLKNKSAIEKIIAALDLRGGDTIIEIGPGHGELTDELLGFSFEVLEKEKGGAQTKPKIIAVEKDRNLAEFLRKKFAANKNVEVIEGDALKMLPQLSKTYNLKPKTWKLVGNIPYYITGHLLRAVSELEAKPGLCVFTIQKEVAERIAAAPPEMNPVRSSEGTKHASASRGMNRLAASVQFWARPEILAILDKKDFSPPPEVDSAIIKLEAQSMNREMDAETYYETVRMLFAQPRKTILNNLASKKEGAATKEKIMSALEHIGINHNDRPQDLSVEKIILIAAHLRAQKK